MCIGREKELHTHALPQLAGPGMAWRNSTPHLAGARFPFVVLFFGDLCYKSARYENLNRLELQVCEIWKS